MKDETGARAAILEYLRVLDRAIGQIDLADVERIHARLQSARDSGHTIYLAGNGGSAATASHWANDLAKATRRPGAKPIRVVCLSDHGSWVTALANDEGYERVFAAQVENLVTPGDVLVVFSASGNSPNLIRAVDAAHALGGIAIGFLGFDGGALQLHVDEALWLPTPRGAYGPVEDVHLILCHMLTAALAATAHVELAADASAAQEAHVH